ncbi:MAG: M3 family oligoendopeptidase [Spirochaetales bacterium]|nr:M3 family oligoendopeptidase [Spirochaetales bacterium]
MKEKLPLWDLNMYDRFEGKDFSRDGKEFREMSDELKALMEEESLWSEEPLHALEKALPLINRCWELYENMESYTYCRYSVDTGDGEALNRLNKLEEEAMTLQQGMVLFNNRLAETGTGPEEWAASPVLKDFIFFLSEAREDRAYQMAPELEDLAADLSRSGGSAWGRLQQSLSATLKTEWEPGEWKTVTQLRLMAADPDREIRRKAWELELKCWKSVETALAASLNGVKGFTHTLNSRRGYDSTLQRSVRQARMERKTLDAMIEAMEESLPLFRRYLKAKAAKMGLETLSWYDIIAPAESSARKWEWEETRAFIEKNFAALSPAYGEFGKKAFEENWIDARPREGKVGGAYCIGFPLQKESRIMTNFDGSFTDVSTVAHELGHAWHSDVLKDAPPLHRDYPMTLAETASIFSEILVSQSYYGQAAPEEKEALLGESLADANQVITDILSRFYFERELMERRAEGELSAEELNEMMLRAQEATYGEALNREERHPWMWAVKGHYYSQDLAFYNFPYAFGLLFAWGLYSLYEEMGADFEPLYRQVLEMTGKAGAEECAARAGIDLTDKAFWRRSLERIGKQIEEFCGPEA